jgi:hypothetical protein
MSQLDEYRHLWDGSEPGWTLVRVDRVVWRLVFEFGESGPTQLEIASLRTLLDEFRDIPLSTVWKRLKGLRRYEPDQQYGDNDCRTLSERAAILGLRVQPIARDAGGCVPISPGGCALIIENNALAKEVTDRMREAGVPISRTIDD